jgi:hypothetical protein
MWENDPLFSKLLDPTRVILSMTTPLSKVVADNRRYNVSSLVLIDVCVPYLISGQLPIMDLLTNGRSMWLTVISLWQSGVRSGTVGNIVHVNKATVLFFRTMINTVSKVPEWVPEDDAKVFKSVTRSELGKHWAGVINTDKSSLPKIHAPPLYAITTLGQPELTEGQAHHPASTCFGSRAAAGACRGAQRTARASVV